MTNVVLIIIFILSAGYWYLRNHIAAAAQPVVQAQVEVPKPAVPVTLKPEELSLPVVTYADVSGEVHYLAGTAKPALIVFWLNGSEQSTKAMNLLAAIRPDYAENKLDLIGFYMDEINSEALSQTAQSSSYFFTIAGAAQTPELKAALFKSFHVRGPGKDIYVVDKAGKITAVDVSDPKIPEDLLLDKVTKAFKGLI